MDASNSVGRLKTWSCQTSFPDSQEGAMRSHVTQKFNKVSFMTNISEHRSCHVSLTCFYKQLDHHKVIYLIVDNEG